MSVNCGELIIIHNLLVLNRQMYNICGAHNVFGCRMCLIVASPTYARGTIACI